MQHSQRFTYLFSSCESRVIFFVVLTATRLYSSLSCLELLELEATEPGTIQL